MSLVEIDNSGIKNNLFPLCASESSYLSAAASSASKAGCGGSIGEFPSRFSKYDSWIRRINSKMESRISTSVEAISSVKVDEIKKSDIVVNK